MKALYIVTGSCPQTQAEARLEYADILEAGGDSVMAGAYRAIVDRMRREWDDPREHVKYKLGLRKVEPMDPDELVPGWGTMFWHEPRYSATVVCPCGHFALFLCDQPVGSGRTCDAPLCKCCRTEVAEGIDQCDFHVRTEPIVAKMVAKTEAPRTDQGKWYRIPDSNRPPHG